MLWITLELPTVREVPGKSPGNLWESGGNSGKSSEFPEAPGKSDSLPAARPDRLQNMPFELGGFKIQEGFKGGFL